MSRRRKDPLRALTDGERASLEQVGRATSAPAAVVARARALLAVAAIVGQEVPLALWGAVTRQEEEPLLDLVERAAGAHLLAATPDGAPSLGSGGSRCFENGLCVRGRFADYWEQHGGLRQQGLPISPEFPEISPTNGQEYRVQYFERGRFEYHPENDTPYDVLLGLLGREQFLAKYPGGQPPKPGEPVYQVGVYVSDPTPPTHGEVTVVVDVGRNYQPIGQRYRIETTWRFQSGPRACNATSNIEDGSASCTLNIGAAPAGVTVTIDVLVLLSDGVRLAVRTSFIPRDG